MVENLPEVEQFGFEQLNKVNEGIEFEKAEVKKLTAITWWMIRVKFSIAMSIDCLSLVVRFEMADISERILLYFF